MKIRLFALAKELGLDSKELIQHCEDAGLSVKSSPLASLTSEERDVLMAHLEKVRSRGSSGAPQAPQTPVREMIPPERGGKIRQIRTISPPPRSRKGREEEELEPEESTPAAAEQLADDAEQPATETMERPPDDESAEPSEDTPLSESETDGPERGESTRRGPVGPGPKREEYVPPTGAGLSGIREMKPRGSVRESEPKPRRERSKKTPALPSVATPNFKPSAPAARKEEAPAQKPDVPLSPSAIKQNAPLADIIKRHKGETGKRRPDLEEEEESRTVRGTSLGLQEAREERRRRRQKTRGVDEEGDTATITRVPKRQRRAGPVELKTHATISLPITVREFSAALGRPARDLIGILFRAGKPITINDTLDEETAYEIALELGVELEIERRGNLEQELEERLALSDEELGAPLLPRAPVVTILGHVDHGKTTLIDRLRSSNVVAGEAGGITQHIAAYQVEHNGQWLTFVDTPGHAAFGEMRARGANVTDIVVLVVAADDGVMPQTVECISHARAAGVPIVVALNKMDLPDINEQRILTELSQHEVLPAEWGGDTEIVRVSALNGNGIDNLLETLLLTAELHEYKAPRDLPGEGVCLEAFRDPGLGPIAWLVVRRGTLRIGDAIVCGTASGRVRVMSTDRDTEVREVGPSEPVRVAGLDSVPDAGDHFLVMDDVEEARRVAEQRYERGRAAVLSRQGGPKTLEEFFAGPGGGVRELPLIIKADTPGSIEALRGELEKFKHPEVRIRILHAGVGGVNESDVSLAAASGAIIIAFHVVADDAAVEFAQNEGVDIRRYTIIYNVTDEIRQALEGLLEPERVEVTTGRALVLRTFTISRTGVIAGCRVLNGTIERNNRVHVIRDQTIINDYAIASLRREKDDVREVREGLECGIRLDGFNDIKEGDLLEAFRIEERKRTLDE